MVARVSEIYSKTNILQFGGVVLKGRINVVHNAFIRPLEAGFVLNESLTE